MSGELQIFSATPNPALAHEICAYLGTKLGEATVGSFSDGEIRVKIEENVRGGDVFVVQSSCQPVNDSLMELLIIIDALKRSSANRITAVIPYFGYAVRIVRSATCADFSEARGRSHQYRWHRPGADDDLHAGRSRGSSYTRGPSLCTTVLLDYITKQKVKVSDLVSSRRRRWSRAARAFAKRLEANLAIIDKRREGPNQTQIMNIIGDVAGRVRSCWTT